MCGNQSQSDVKTHNTHTRETRDDKLRTIDAEGRNLNTSSFAKDDIQSCYRAAASIARYVERSCHKTTMNVKNQEDNDE